MPRVPALAAALLCLALPASAQDAVRLTPAVEADLPGVALSVRPLAGNVRWLGGRKGLLVDLTDYTRAGELEAPSGLLLVVLGREPVMVPPGLHELGFAGGADSGGVLLILKSADGFLLQVPLAVADRPATPPLRLGLRGRPAATGGWALSVDLPTASAGLLFAASQSAVTRGDGGPGLEAPGASAQAAPKPAPSLRRQSRADLIQQRLRERAGQGTGARDRDKPRRPREPAPGAPASSSQPVLPMSSQ